MKLILEDESNIEIYSDRKEMMKLIKLLLEEEKIYCALKSFVTHPERRMKTHFSLKVKT